MKLSIRDIKNRLHKFVWETSETDYPRWQRSGVIAMRILYLLIRELKEGQLNLRAMGLVYTTLLAMVPLIAVSFSVLKGFGVHNQVEPLLMNIMEPLGEKGIEITERIISFVDNVQAGVLGSLGLAMLIYTVVSLLQKVERAFNFTWRVTTHRPLSQRFSDYITLILIGPLLIFTALGVTASISNISLLQKVMEIEAIGFVVSSFAYVVPFLLIVTVSTLVYMLVPNVTVKFTPALVGALVAGLLWQTSSWAFANFVAGSTKYTAIYSAFASLIIFMVWLYLNWAILLIGCTVAFYYQHPEHRSLRARTVILSNRIREKLSLHIMLLVARHFRSNKPAWSIEELVKVLNINGEICGTLIDALVNNGLLLRTTDHPARITPAYSIETMKISDVLNSVRREGEVTSFSMDSLPADAVVDTIYTDIESAIYKSIEDRTLYSLAADSTT